MKGSMLLEVAHLAVSVEGREVLRDVDLAIRAGEVHAIMGPNGSGKSTLVYALMGHPAYAIGSPTARMFFKKKSIRDISSEERARRGLFLALQSPIAVPGVTVSQLLRTALEERSQKVRKGSAKYNPVFVRKTLSNGMSILDFMKKLKNYASFLKITPELMGRGIHDGFSGGEKKKIEMLQALMLTPALAMFDEIDTGLDVDALKIVAGGIMELKKQGTAVLLVTHYQRILRFVVPDYVHVLVSGNIVATGHRGLVSKIEKEGYGEYTAVTAHA